MPYRDELLYSLIARYHELSGNYLMRDTIFQLFGDKFQSRSTVIPARLGFMSKQTNEYDLDFDTLLNEHTIYPFLTTFASTKNVEAIYRKLRNNEKGAFYADLGLFNYNAKPKNLRYCPLCYQEESNIYGEAYWHRLHQTPGIMICEKHYVLLCESTIPYDAKHDRNYETANSIIGKIKEFNIDPNLNNSFYSIITNSILFLYHENKRIRKIFLSYNCSFSGLFIQLLNEKGYATQNGSIRQQKLLSGFQKYFGKEELEYLGYEVDKEVRPWLISICRSERVTWDPIKYILIGIFLCGSFEAFINIAEQNLFKFPPQKQKLSYNKCYDSEKLEVYRTRWINARKNALQDTRNCIIEQDRSAYTWLMRHDKQWLLENYPPPQKRGGNKVFSNWNERDNYYSSRIPTIAQKLFKNGTEKPVRVTKAKLCKQLGLNSTVISNNFLPNTEKALIEWSEPQDQFHYRKIVWAISECKKEGLPIVNWQILKKAG